MGELNPEQLAKGLSELEDIIAKGDALQSASHDGGFATEGTNLQAQARKVQKALQSTGVEISIEKAEKIVKMMSASDMGSEEGDEGDDDSAAKSIQEDFAPDDSFLKSIVAGADDPEEMDGMIDASDFLKSLVAESAKNLQGVRGDFSALSKSNTDRFDNQQQFNVKMAQGMAYIGKSLQKLSEQYEAVAGAPVPNNTSVTLLKSDIAPSPIHQGSRPVEGIGVQSGDYMTGSPLLDVPLASIQELLIEKSINKKIPALLVTEFESNKDFSVLPKNIFKALEQELCGGSV